MSQELAEAGTHVLYPRHMYPLSLCWLQKGKYGLLIKAVADSACVAIGVGPSHPVVINGKVHC